MLSKSKILSKSLVVTSPILIISALTVFLSFSSIINYEEDVLDIGQDMPDINGGNGAVLVDASDIWAAYNRAQTNDELVVTYTGNEVKVSGIFSDWEITSDNDVIIKLSTSTSAVLVHCVLLEKYYADDPAYDLMQIDSYKGEEILVTGISEGWEDGVVIVSKCVDIALSGGGSVDIDIEAYSISSINLWEAYEALQTSQGTENEITLATKDKKVSVEGILASWELNEEGVLIIRLFTVQDEALVRCVFIPEDIEEDTFVYDLPQVEESIGHKVTIEGTCDGWLEGKVVISGCKEITFGQKNNN